MRLGDPEGMNHGTWDPSKRAGTGRWRNKKNMGKYGGLTKELFCKHGTTVNHRKHTENHKGQKTIAT